jgi:hypothetical protein
MKRVCLALLACVSSWLVGVSPTSALQTTPTTSYNGSPIVQKITITGIVPFMRVIYINQTGKIIKVLGNTDQNIEPQVIWAQSNDRTIMTPSIDRQYQAILTAHHNQLEAGKTYYPAPPSAQVKTASTAKHTPAILGLSVLKLISL